ncbi:response regulator [Parachryseolinea silvisoli]|uniref:response regulator n=1 Tax=Parachryseolinea silvisoli TaxID=2873601 RepID=UPI002265B1DB|nr:response regulator [Parachryseolinea silvisoli]MCD9020125.1 response regulator [Parachryseolinea silvisoli]
MKKLRCIMLIDDNPDDNFFHQRVIKKADAAEVVIAENSGMGALEYLKLKKDHPQEHPDLIFLDINMPGMNGWEFLEEYEKLDKDLQSRVIIVMLTTSENPDDRMKAMNIVPEFRTKPLTKEMLEEIINKYF